MELTQKIDSLTFDINIAIKGSIVVILGPSNSGKSHCLNEIRQWLKLDKNGTINNPIVLKAKPTVTRYNKNQNSFFSKNCNMVQPVHYRLNVFTPNNSESMLKEIKTNLTTINELIQQVYPGQEMYFSNDELCWGNSEHPSSEPKFLLQGGGVITVCSVLCNVVIKKDMNIHSFD
jgi:ABC-type lipoprotein export system ATPase subunit